MDGLFVKSADFYIPVSLVTAASPKSGVTGLSAATIPERRVLKPDGSLIELPASHIVSAANGVYRILLSATQADIIGMYLAFLSGGSFERKELSFRITEKNIDDIFTGADAAVLSGSLQSQFVGLENHITSVSGSLTSNGCKIITDGLGSASVSVAAAQKVADYVWDEATSGHTGAGTYGKFFEDLVTSIWAAGTKEITGLSAVAIDSIWNRPTATIMSGIGLQVKTNLDAVLSTMFSDIKGSGFVKDTHSLKQILSAAAQGTVTSLVAGDITAIAEAVRDTNVATTLGSLTLGRAIAIARASAIGEFTQAAGGGAATLKDIDAATVKVFTLTRDADENITDRA